MKNKTLGIAALSFLFSGIFFISGCGIFGKDGQTTAPDYHSDGEGNRYTFVLELRETGTGEERAEGDFYPHSTLDGELIYSWIVPMYGNTVYESVCKYFENRADDISFRLSQHRYYMFRDCTLEDGRRFNLETVYVAANGEYAYCANFQSVLGSDGIAGTEDDLKTLTLVYRGWLYG